MWNRLAKNAMFLGITSLAARYAIADTLVQYTEPAPFNYKRTLSFVLFACTVATPYTLFHTKVLKNLTNIWQQIALDHFGFSMIFFFPLFYTMNEAVLHPQRMYQPASLIGSAACKYRDNIVQDMRNLILFWTPLQYTNFRFVPVHLRVPYVSVLGFLWSVILSHTRGSEPVLEKPIMNTKHSL